MAINQIDSLEEEQKEGAGIMVAVDVVIIDQEGLVLLGKRLATAGSGTWGLPGGHLKAMETIHDCAARELEEEMGEDIKVEITNEIISVRENAIAPHRIHHLMIAIAGKYLGGDPQNMEPEKCEKWEWFSLDALPTPLFSCVGETLKAFQEGKSRIVSDW